MKKIFLLGFICLMGLMGREANAQFSDYGVKLGLGVATISDDLSTKSPILGMNVGGYVNFTFAKSKSVLAEIFYLQTGLNITRRGRSHEQVLQTSNRMSLRVPVKRQRKKFFIDLYPRKISRTAWIRHQ